MKTPLIFAIIIMVSFIFATGCDRSRDGSYPDSSVNTTRRVENIRESARDQKDAVDVEADRLSTRHDFDERQIRQKYKAERQEFANESNEETTKRDAKIREIQIQAKHDKEIVAAEVKDRLKTSAPEEAAGIHAVAANRKAEIDSKATEDLAPIYNASERSKATYTQRGLDIDRDEAKEISNLEKNRSIARNQRNDQMLKIDQWTNQELAKVAQDSKSDRKSNP